MGKLLKPTGFVATVLLVITGIFIVSGWVVAAGETISGSTSFSGLKNTQIPLNNIQINGTGNPTVPVRLFVSHGSLSFGSTTGLSFTGASTGGQIEFSGSLTNVNAALATLRYTRSVVGTDTLEISLVESGEIFFSDNNHLYEYVAVPGNITWTNAKTAAEAREKYGSSGYLATVTSIEENDFISDRLEGAGWMGASDSAVEGTWRWVTGPENGTQFWTGNGSGSIFSGRYANWNNINLPNSGTGSEPNNSGDEDCGQFLAGTTGLWNDLPCGNTIGGYVVEYGASGDMPTVASQDVTITTTAIPNTPTSLGGSGVTNGSWSTTTAPTLQFSMTDEDTGDSLRYRVQVDDTANFSSPVIDYQSGPKSQGSFNFVVGQAAGLGTSGVGAYTVGSQNQVLSDGQYYWRVKSIDDSGNESAYTVANSGSIAFGVDTAGPTTPGAPTATTPTNDTTPALSWAASTDSRAGLHSTPYVLQWSQDPDFTSSSSASVTAASHTLSSALAEGTWYFRVRARDSLSNYSNYSASSSVVVDTTGPAVNTKSPVDNAVNILRNQNLVLTFDEPVTAGSGTVRIYRNDDDSLVESVAIGSGQVTIADEVVTINPNTTLEYDTQYYVQVSAGALRDSTTNSYSGIANKTSWNFTTEGTDFDSDGISSEIENASPNSGDANNDGTQDSEQSNVSSFMNPYSNQYTVLAVDEACDITSVSSVAETETKDTRFDYPVGLLNFTLDCGTPGFTTYVQQYYFGTSGDLVVRKYNPNTKTYATIDSASLQSINIDGATATLANYAVTDGGNLDTDGVVDGRIADPAGLAQAVSPLADTGQSQSFLITAVLAVIITGLLPAVYIARRAIAGSR